MTGQPQGPSLTIVAHGASNLKNIEMFGKQDPYLRFTLDITNPKSFQKTFVHKSAGQTPVWNQSFDIPLNGEPDLFIEIMDEATTTDGVIAYAAIPINQVVHAPGGSMSGFFDVFLLDGSRQGEVSMTLTARNVPGQPMATPGYASAPVKGYSYVVEAHQKRIKSLKNKETATDVGIAAAGGLFALGAGLLANKVISDNREEEEERHRAEEEQERERERLEREKRQLEQEREAFERAQAEEEARERWEREREPIRETIIIRETRRDSDDDDDEREDYHDRHRHRGCDADEWDPCRYYCAGDKVSYHGCEFMCLQPHQSNPTWQPTEAHSLWRAE
ncbi:hypothetical protein EC968_007649 [Mortierella alpina]|nr:hypothetical protein EC968_007649 [Mortierella alpina]